MKQKIERLAPYLWMVGIALELIVLAAAWSESNGETNAFFQAAARLSGRVSLLFFVLVLVHATLVPSFDPAASSYRAKYTLYRDFAIVHVIHFFLLAVSVRMNNFELLPIRVAGGALAYGLIVVFPFLIHRRNQSLILLTNIQMFYLFWVWLVFVMTYASRLSGSTPVHSGTPGAWWPLFMALIVLMFWRAVLLLLNWLSDQKSRGRL